MKKPTQFRARPAVVDEHRRRQIEAMGGRAVPLGDQLIILEDFLAMSIRRRDRPFAMFKLQGNLLLDLVDQEKFVAGYKDKVAELETAGEAEAKIVLAKSEWMMHQRVRTALRDIGDGIAWRLLDFNRGALTQLARRARKQHINLDGLGAELAELGEAFNQYGRVAILNDLTHYLKKGDITARVDDSMIEFIEVKSSKTKSSTLRRQRADLIETVSFLNEGGKIEDGERYEFIALPTRPSSHVRVVGKVIDRAEKHGFAVERIGDHLVVHALDFENASKHDVGEDPGFSTVRRIAESWASSGDFVFDHASIDRYAHVQNVAPFSVYPLPHRQRVKLMTGALWLIATINISAVLRYLEQRGWSVIKDPKDHFALLDPEKPQEIPIATLRKERLTIELPAQWIGRVVNEFLTPRTIADMLDALLAAGPRQVDGLFVILDHEASLWD